MKNISEFTKKLVVLLFNIETDKEDILELSEKIEKHKDFDIKFVDEFYKHYNNTLVKIKNYDDGYECGEQHLKNVNGLQNKEMLIKILSGDMITYIEKHELDYTYFIPFNKFLIQNETDIDVKYIFKIYLKITEYTVKHSLLSMYYGLLINDIFTHFINVKNFPIIPHIYFFGNKIGYICEKGI